jgi:hypothetical protein
MARPPWAARTPNQKLVHFLRKLAFSCIMLGDRQGEQQYSRLLNYLLSRRYLAPHVPRIPQDRQHLQFLMYLPCYQFRIQARCTQDTFARLLELISTHDVFLPRGKKQQKSVCEQLFNFLVFVGHEGNGSGRSFTAHNLGASTGSAFNFSSRVVQALLSFKDMLIKWPDYNVQQTLAATYGATHCLPHVFGAIIDGTHFFFFNNRRTCCSHGSTGLGRKAVTACCALLHAT